MKHKKYEEVKTLIKENISVLLTGEAGSGKTTLIKKIAEDLNYSFNCISMTRQTTLSSLLGFKNITTGDYVPTSLRNAVEYGGLLLLDEIDAADPNVLLCLNTLENGFIAFPDRIVETHRDFRICATCNPQGKQYTGRAVLDAATLDRFDSIDIHTDTDLEKHLVGDKAFGMIKDVRLVLTEYSSDKKISMRDSIRLKKRLDLNITGNFIEKLLGNDITLIENYSTKRSKKDYLLQSNCKNIDELYVNLKKQAGVFDEKST
jgi:MoxR-like ATPase